MVNGVTNGKSFTKDDSVYQRDRVVYQLVGNRRR